MDKNAINLSKDFIFISVIIALIIAYCVTGNIISYTFCTLCFLIFITNQLIREIGRTIPVREIMAGMVILQCLLAPAIAYEVDYFSIIDMSVSSDKYFSFVLPAVVLYFVGLYWKKQPVSYKIQSSPFFKNKGWVLISIGILGDIIDLGFLSHLLSSFKFIGAFYLLFSDSKYKYWGFIILLCISAYQSLSKVMFHELLIWLLFIFFVLNLKKRMSYVTIIFSILVGIGLFAFIQLIKPLMRDILWHQTTNVSTNEALQQSLSKAEIEDSFLIGQVVRLNEGWHISKVLAHIPEYADYGNGESYCNSIIASLVPRFLMPNKAQAGGRQNMKRYAGYEPIAGTSMDISLIGEAYGNFGYFGILVMFFIGFFFGKIIRIIEKRATTTPELLLWLPFIFFQVIKAETSSITVFNHLIKSSLIVWFLFSKYAKYLPFGEFLGLKQHKYSKINQ